MTGVLSIKRHGGLKLILISEDTYRKSYISCAAFPVPQNTEDESICAVSLASRGVGFSELSFLKVRNDGISRRFGGNISASRGNISGNAYLQRSDFLLVNFFINWYIGRIGQTPTYSIERLGWFFSYTKLFTDIAFIGNNSLVYTNGTDTVLLNQIDQPFYHQCLRRKNTDICKGAQVNKISKPVESAVADGPSPMGHRSVASFF